MTVYRVGPEGATVFTADGRPLCRLRAGQIVVPGTIDQAGSLADQHQETMEGKRVRGYPNKRRPPVADKQIPNLDDPPATPPAGTDPVT